MIDVTLPWRPRLPRRWPPLGVWQALTGRAGWMMARRWLVVAVLLVPLGGCADEPEAEPATVPVPVTSSAAPVPSPSAVAATRAATAWAERPPPADFGTEVRRELPALAVDRRDEEIDGIAEQTCAALAAGRPARAVVDGVRAYGADAASARALIKLAIAAQCPGQDRRAGEF